MSDASNDPPSPPPDNQRAASRQRVLLTGRIVHSPHELTLDCAIQDLSETGARIRLNAPEAIMDPAYLIDVRHGVGFQVKVVWRRELRAGLVFTDRYDLKNPGPACPKSIVRLWRQANV